jgi:arginyl-tRNA--protein-N-Asp/Glu arginylyltransferase
MSNQSTGSDAPVNGNIDLSPLLLNNWPMSYIDFGTKEVAPRNNEAVIDAYNQGFVFTRTELGHMTRVRSLRVRLSEFLESSENRRILRKYQHTLSIAKVPYPGYNWEIHKMGKDFYDTKFGKDTFSANKIKELFTSQDTNFGSILTFVSETGMPEGYCIVNKSISESSKILHYAYPFYRLDLINSSFGIFMMTRTIQYCKNEGFDYIYLGSVHEPSSLYKLQFKGLEWFDEKTLTWKQDLDALKARVRGD